MNKKILLVFKLHDRGLLFDVYWCEPSGQRFNAIGNKESKINVLSDKEREQWIRLSSFARKGNFKCMHESKSYLLEDANSIVHFLSIEMVHWRDYFEIEEEEGVQFLKKGNQELDLRANAFRSKDGVKIDWDLYLNGVMLDVGARSKILTKTNRTWILPQYGMVHLPKDKVSAFEEWKYSLEDIKNIPKYMLFSVLAKSGIQTQLSAYLDTWCKSLSKLPQNKKILPHFLREYQKRGVMWMWHLCDEACHGLLADDMGLGKTLQVLTLLSCRKVRNRKQLIVCPASVVPVWVREIKEFFPHLEVNVLDRRSNFSEESKDGVWVASYTQLRQHRYLLSKVKFGYAILDEGQSIKNPETKIAQTCLLIQAKHRIVLTGTPIENKTLDLWSLFQFLMPGFLGSRQKFESRSLAEGSVFESFLSKQIAPFVLRRTKSEVLHELPRKIEIECICPMKGLQKREYMRLTEEGVNRFGNDLHNAMSKSSMGVLTLLTRLRQVCCNVGLLPWFDSDTLESGKVEVLFEKLEEILNNRQKVVIFSQFVSLLDQLEFQLDRRFSGVPLCKLTGRTLDRAKPVEFFQELKGSAIALISLKAGCTGITLHSAEYVFLMDPWWNPAVESQAIDRVHRLGQENQVFVYRMITSGTIEERIQRMKFEKKEVFLQVLGKMRDISSLNHYKNSLSELIHLVEENRDYEEDALEERSVLKR